MKLHYHEHQKCLECGDLFVLLFPLGYVFFSTRLVREAIADYELDVAQHRADCINARVTKEIFNGKTV